MAYNWKPGEQTGQENLVQLLLLSLCTKMRSKAEEVQQLLFVQAAQADVDSPTGYI